MDTTTYGRASRRHALARFFLTLCLIAAATLGSSGLAVAAEPDATITVTTVQDELNSSVPCSLREAIQAANQNTAVGGCPAGGSNAGCPATDQRGVARG